MESAPLPANEVSRKAALDALAVLDTPAEREFDDLVIAASLACGVPISLISLVDSHRQWFKANVGLPGVSETPRDVAFCAHAIHDDAVFEVPNALADARFADNPLVADKPDIRFYAGAPITLKDGSRVGTLCVIDRIPHQLSAAQQEILTRLASAAARALETRQAELQLKVEQQKLQDILAGTAAGTWSWSIETGAVELNERWAEILGKSLSELQPISIQTWMEHIHPDDMPVAQKALDQHFSGELPSYECEMRMRHKNGGWAWVLARGKVVLRDDTGRALRISGIHLDVSARHNAMDAANRATRYLRSTLDAIPSLVAYWDTNLINQFANKAYTDYFGVAPEFILGQHISKILGDGIYQKNLPMLEAALRGEEQNFERAFPSLEGKPTRYTKAKYLPDVVKGVVKGLYVFVFDVSDIKAAQEKLVELNAQLEQRTLEAEAASSSKSTFLANMSHEIRTPMNAILGLLDLLQSTELTDRQRDYSSKTEGAARSLLGLLNDILDFSKVEAGKMTLESEPFRIDKLLRNLSTILSSNVGSKDIEVLFDIDARLPAVVCGDAMRLQQVLINLGGNAVKFTSQGQVVLAMHMLSQQEKSVTIQFAVQDTGIGIAPEHQAHIFSGFSQAEGSTTRRFGGTGLGLAISKRFVELMGGGIEITSTPGVGSTFSFALVMPTVELAPELLSEPDRTTVAPQRTLVVDDNPIAGELTLRMVRSWGWVADLATSGKQALEMVAAFPYPVIYMDWKMPDMDGWKVTRRIRDMAKVGNMPQPLVVMITAHGRETLALRTEAEQDMINGFLVKPVTASMLHDALIDAASGNTSIRKIAKGRNITRQLVGMRILVVEDNLINQQVADELLTAQGAIVSLAANGQVGVDAVAAAAPQFDVVLMDVQMPVLDGYGATRAIRNELGLTDLPIVAMTANAMASDRETCIAAGMNEHVGKPFNLAKLVSLLVRMTGLQPSPVLMEESLSAPADMQNVPEITGLELQTALNRMSGMRSLYLRTARSFVRAMDTVIPEIQSCLAVGDKQKALMRLHTLKGNAGTLGATALAAKAEKLEKLCATDAGMQSCEKEMGPFAVLVRSTQEILMEAIARLESPPADGKSIAEPSGQPPVSDAARGALRRIADMAEAFNLEALQEFAQARDLLAEFPVESVDALDLALQELDLELASTLCDAMLSSLSE